MRALRVFENAYFTAVWPPNNAKPKLAPGSLRGSSGRLGSFGHAVCCSGVDGVRLRSPSAATSGGRLIFFVDGTRDDPERIIGQ
jgi:hypothetical protein